MNFLSILDLEFLALGKSFSINSVTGNILFPLLYRTYHAPDGHLFCGLHILQGRHAYERVFERTIECKLNIY